MTLLSNDATASHDALLERSPIPASNWRDRTAVRSLGRRITALTVLLLTGVAFVTPVGFVFNEAFADEARGVREVLASERFWEALRTTALLTVGIVPLAVTLGTIFAWFAHRLPPGRRWLGAIPLMPIVVPHLSLLLGFAFLFSPQVGFGNTAIRAATPLGGATGPVDVYTITWIVIVTGLALSAIVFLFVRSALSNLDQELIDAAAVTGAGNVRTFFRVVLPLAKPGIVYGGLTVTLLSLGQFAAPLVLGRAADISVLTTEMYFATSGFPADYPVAAGYGLPILVVGLVFLLVQRVVLRDQNRYVTSTGRGGRPASANGLVAQGALFFFGLFAVILPLGAVAVVSLQPFWNREVAPSDFTLRHFRSVFGQPDLTQAITNSLTYALVATFFTLLIGLVCARTIYRRRHMRVIAALQDIVISAPLGIPSVIFGVGFLLAYLASPVALYGRPAAMVLLYTTIMIPYSTRTQLVAMANIGEDPADAAAACGAGFWRRVTAVEIPMLRPALGSAAALVVILTTHEFSASLFVRSQETQVIGTILYDLWTFGSYPEAAVMALIMSAITGIGVAAAVALSGTRLHSKVVY